MAPGDREQAILDQGIAILAPALLSSDFKHVPGGRGFGSGGPSAEAAFTRKRQVLSLHFRHSLGLVTYRWRGIELSHQEFLRGVGRTGTYPGFSDDPLDGFRHLRADLEGPLKGWVTGRYRDFAAAAKAAETPPASRFP
jgi:hypothetical protein